MGGPRSDIERIWREQGSTLWRALVAYAGDQDIASDAMAEAVAQALGRGDEIRDHERWVWAVSFRIAAGELQRRAASLAPEAAGRRAEIMLEPVVDVVNALRELSPNQRAAAVLHYYADKPTREVAQILGCSQTVRALGQGRDAHGAWGTVNAGLLLQHNSPTQRIHLSGTWVCP